MWRHWTPSGSQIWCTTFAAMVTLQPYLTPCSASSMDHGALMSSRSGQLHCSALLIGYAVWTEKAYLPACLPCCGCCLAGSCSGISTKAVQMAVATTANMLLGSPLLVGLPSRPPPATAWLPAGMMTVSWCLCWRRGSRGYPSRPRWQQLHSGSACMHQPTPAGMHLSCMGLAKLAGYLWCGGSIAKFQRSTWPSVHSAGPSMCPVSCLQTQPPALESGRCQRFSSECCGPTVAH